MTESKAVSWYLCAKYAPELLGSGPQESATVRMLQEILNDMTMGIVIPGFRGTDPTPSIERAHKDMVKIAAFLEKSDKG